MLAGRQLQTTGPIGMRPGRPRLLHRPDAISSSYTTLSFFFFFFTQHCLKKHSCVGPQFQGRQETPVSITLPIHRPGAQLLLASGFTLLPSSQRPHFPQNWGQHRAPRC